MARPVLSRMGTAIMQSAVKPGATAMAKAFARGVAPEELPVIKTLLTEGVNVSPGGIAKLNRIITSSNDDIVKALGAVPNGRVYPEAVAKRLEDVTAKAATQVNPEADVAAVQGAGEEFLRSRAAGGMRPSTPLTLPEAQALKTGTYRSLSEKAYGEMKAPAIEAQKALARGLKEDIADEAAKAGVDITQANAREGAAIVTRDAIAKRIAAAGNRDPVALAWLAHNPTAGLLFLAERSPAVKSLIARGLYQSAANAANVPMQVMRLLVSSVAQSSDEKQP